VGEVATAIRSITEESARVKTLVEEGSLGSQELTRGIEQVAKAVQRMEHLTPSSAARAEAGTETAEKLVAQSEVMKEAVIRLVQMVGANESSSGRRTCNLAIGEVHFEMGADSFPVVPLASTQTKAATCLRRRRRDPQAHLVRSMLYFF
jgi:hypothetical protein